MADAKEADTGSGYDETKSQQAGGREVHFPSQDTLVRFRSAGGHKQD